MRCTSCRFSYVSYLFFLVNVSALFKFVLQPRSVLGLRVLSLYAKMANGINFSFPPNGARGPFYVLERKFERTDDARTEEGGTTEHKTFPLVCSAITSHPSNLMAALPTAALL